MKRELKALKVDVYHHDCVGCLLTYKYPNVSMKNLSYSPIFGRNGKMAAYQIVVEITADTDKELDGFMRELKAFKTVREFEVWSRLPRKVFAFVRVKTNNSSYGQILKSGAMHLDHTRMEGGYDVHSVVTKDRRQLKGMLNNLDQIGEVKIKKIGMPTTVRLESDLMTEKQVEALRKAISHDYYSWPRKVTLEFLARQSNMSRRAYQEHLRKAESKLFPELVGNYLLMRRIA